MNILYLQNEDKIKLNRELLEKIAIKKGTLPNNNSDFFILNPSYMFGDDNSYDIKRYNAFVNIALNKGYELIYINIKY